MSWLTPLGFLGAIGIVALILIHVIRPNFQNKRISSTYVWRLSLKYRKKTIPVSKIQNLLIFLCQALILATLSTMLAGPIIENAMGRDEDEVVIIVDASAGMRINDGTDTRFDRALAEAKRMVEKTLDEGSSVSVILADETPEFILRREEPKSKKDSVAVLDQLISDGLENCSWASADMSEAITLSETVLESNPKAQVYLLSSTSYTHHNGVTVVDVSGENEWNATILDCEAELNNDNHYEINVDVACYGKTEYLTVFCKVYGVNGGDSSNTVSFEKEVSFDPSAEEKSISFKTDDYALEPIYSYDYIETRVSVRDSFSDDNVFVLYGGKKPVIKVQYASSSPNNFFESVIRSLRQKYREVWDLQFTSLRADEEFATEGFDLYIFEHEMPEALPTDGVVLLVDPTTAPADSGLQIGGSYKIDSNSILSPGTSHELTKYVDPQRVTISKYNDILLSEGYEELAFYNGRPVMLLKDTEEAKVIVWAFDLNYSNIIALPDFSFLVYNLYNYFIPPTLSGNAFEIGDTVKLNSRGTELRVTGNGEEYTFDGKGGELTLLRPDTYTVTQKTMGGETISEKFFVKIAAEESDPTKTVDVLPSVEYSDNLGVGYQDLLLYFAIALVLLMFAEWAFEIKKNY